MTVFLETLWSSNKQTKALYIFDCKHGIALQAMQGNRASSRSEGKFYGFSCVLRESGVYSRVTVGVDIKNFRLFSDVGAPI